MTDRGQLRLTYVAGAFPPATRWGGPAESSFHLCKHLLATGVDVRVLAFAADGDERLDVVTNRWTSHEGVPVLYGRTLGKTLLAPRLYAQLPRAWRDTDIVHVGCGVSPLLVVAAAHAVARGIPFVFSPRGSLLREAMRRHAWRKALFSKSLGRLIYSRTTAFHATSAAEAADIRAFVQKAAVWTVPNGVLIPSSEAIALARSNGKAPPRPYLVYLGRLHPYKQVELILEAFARAKAAEGVELWLVGSGADDYVRRLRGQAGELGIADRVRFHGQARAQERGAILARAEGLVLASLSENFGMSVAEALAHGTPCVVTKTAPWSGLEAEGAGLWVEPSADALAAGIGRLLLRPDRREMGERGREWMRRDFSWPAVAQRMLTHYESIRE